MPVSADFPYESRYVEVDGSRIHYIDEGTGDPMLFLHGNPTSSYLWRNVIPHLTPHARCIAIDLIGMGKSDKPDIAYRFADHARYLQKFIETLNLENITLVIHDWGSALGFHYAHQNEDNIKGIVFMEAILMAAPSWDSLPEEVRIFQQKLRGEEGVTLAIEQNFFIEQAIPAQILRTLTDEEMTAYRAPYLKPEHRKPLLQWPHEIPVGGEPADVLMIINGYNQWLQTTTLPKLLLIANPGSMIGQDMADWCRNRLPNLIVSNCGEGLHFVQEDSPDEVGTAIANWYIRL